MTCPIYQKYIEFAHTIMVKFRCDPALSQALGRLILAHTEYHKCIESKCQHVWHMATTKSPFIDPRMTAELVRNHLQTCKYCK